MLLAAHQPDLLPWTGFWHKMWRAEVFDLAIYDQFQDRGYQRRVQMRGGWASVPLRGKPKLCPISEVRVAPEAVHVLCDLIAGRYRDAPFWRERGPEVLQLVHKAAEHERLWLFNLELILGVREMLQISTPVAIGRPLQNRGTDGLVELCRYYGAQTYLSGTGGKAYLDESVMKGWQIDVLWSKHQSWTGDSILTTLFDKEEPMAWVMAQGYVPSPIPPDGVPAGKLRF